jgi:Tfp pilus tip-associated adhesin PilY1
MEVKFNNKIYKKNKKDGSSLGDLCFNIFEEYLEINKIKTYEELKNIFNKLHCSNNKIVQNKIDYNSLTENQKKRYTKVPNYNYNDELYFSTQWGNNGINDREKNCDNITHMIEFAKSEGFNIEEGGFDS